MVSSQEITALADFVDRLHDLLWDTSKVLPDHEWEKTSNQLYEALQTARARLVTYLAYADDMLVGTEYCNECGEVISRVTKIERGAELMIVTAGLSIYPGDVDCGEYFRLPGSDAYGELALVELARQRATVTQP